MAEFHSEPYLHLAGLTHKAALVTWGAFYFRVRERGRGDDYKLVHDRDLEHVHPPRRETIGARSEPYGEARVDVLDETGTVVTRAETATTNHVWVTGLEPDTEYRYRVMVNDEEWAAGERLDWRVSPSAGLYRSGRSYENRFRTHPAPEGSAPLAFAVLGDFGTGVRHASTTERRQRELAPALERAMLDRGLRFVLTTGDNIYAPNALLGLAGIRSGGDDGDWFFTFYQPYRYILNRIPFYPSVGNHDTSESEVSDDREQLSDNFYLAERFFGEVTAGRASNGPGLFYRFPFGVDVELVSVDTSRNALLFGRRFFEHPNHASFLAGAFPERTRDGPRWRIPFSHHPPYCAGPRHGNTRSMLDALLPLFHRSGVCAVFSGHEHNFQHAHADGIDYFVTGAGGKVGAGAPDRFQEARTSSWAAAAHFLLVEIDGAEMLVTPIGEPGPAGELVPLRLNGVAGRPVEVPIRVKLP